MMPFQIAPILIFAGLGAMLLGKKKSKCDGVSVGGGELEGVVYKEIVTGGADPDEELPMIIAFHGRSSSPDDLIPKMQLIRDPVRIIIPRGPIKNSGKYRWWDLGAKDDQQALAKEMAHAVDQIEDFIIMITACRPTIGKPFVVGHSQGGMMSFALATLHPELVMAAMPASGWLPESLQARKTAPIYAVHGRGDETVPFEWTADYVAKMRQLGADQIFLREVPGGHPLDGELLLRWLDIIRYTLRRGIRDWEEFGHPFG